MRGRAEAGAPHLDRPGALGPPSGPVHPPGETEWRPHTARCSRASSLVDILIALDRTRSRCSDEHSGRPDGGLKSRSLTPSGSCRFRSDRTRCLMAISIRAYSNCDHTYVVWKTEKRIDGCLGF